MLTDTQIKNSKPGKADIWLADDVRQRGVGRLKVRIKPSGLKEFYFVYFVDGKTRKAKLGNYKARSGDGGLSLSDARAESDKYTQMLRNGIDPKAAIEEKRREEALRQAQEEQGDRVGTFGQLLKSYLAWLKSNGKRDDIVADSFECYVERPWPKMVEKKARDITVTDIRDIISRMIKKGVTTQCNRVRSQLHTAFQHGLHADNDPRTYLNRAVMFGIQHNPVSGIPVQHDWERVGDRTLSPMEIYHFWRQLPGLRQNDKGRNLGRMSTVMSCYFRLLLAIGGQRVAEVVRLEWTWIDEQRKLIDIPPEGTKTGRKTGRRHVVPLSDLAIEILEELRPITGHCRYLFAGGPGGGITSNKAIDGSAPSQALRRYTKIYGSDPDTQETVFEHFTPRDLRRTCKTLMGEAGVSKETRDRIQNHSLSDVSTIHYDRYDYLKEKRQGIVVWENYLRWVISGCKEESSLVQSNIVPFR